MERASYDRSSCARTSPAVTGMVSASEIPGTPIALGGFAEIRRKDLGLEVGLYVDYNYTEDLVFRAGFSTFFSGDCLEDGNRVVGNGTAPLLGDDDDTYHYVFVETELSF